MSVIIRQVFPMIIQVFANQEGNVILGDVDGTTYVADTRFFSSCNWTEIERDQSIPLTEEEVTIEDAEEVEENEL